MSLFSAYITGDNKVGSTLSVVIIPSNDTDQYDYQWYRSSIYDGNYEKILGETDSNYLIGLNDKYLLCKIKLNNEKITTNIFCVDQLSIQNNDNSRLNDTSINVGTGMNLTNAVSNLSGVSNIVSNISRINQSIHLIFSTARGEIPMIPSLGSYIHQYIFELTTDDNLSMLEEEAMSCLSEQEPRIEVLQVTATYDDTTNQFSQDLSDHTVYIKIEYLVVGSNIMSSYIYQYDPDTNKGGEIYE